jgi:hypothetical protein
VQLDCKGVLGRPNTTRLDTRLGPPYKTRTR